MARHEAEEFLEPKKSKRGRKDTRSSFWQTILSESQQFLFEFQSFLYFYDFNQCEEKIRLVAGCFPLFEKFA